MELSEVFPSLVPKMYFPYKLKPVIIRGPILVVIVFSIFPTKFYCSLLDFFVLWQNKKGLGHQACVISQVGENRQLQDLKNLIFLNIKM